MIDAHQLLKFKSVCNENRQVATFVRELSTDCENEFLDAGAGFGDIAVEALPNQIVIHLDKNLFDTPLPRTHRRIVGDFFDETFEFPSVNTLMFHHSLQYMDSDLELFTRRVEHISPENIIVTCNTNSGIMGELIQLLGEFSNPEVFNKNMFPNYIKTDCRTFTESIYLNDYEHATDVISYLFDCDRQIVHDHAQPFLSRIPELIKLEQCVMLLRRRK